MKESNAISKEIEVLKARHSEVERDLAIAVEQVEIGQASYLAGKFAAQKLGDVTATKQALERAKTALESQIAQAEQHHEVTLQAEQRAERIIELGRLAREAEVHLSRFIGGHKKLVDDHERALADNIAALSQFAKARQEFFAVAQQVLGLGLWHDSLTVDARAEASRALNDLMAEVEKSGPDLRAVSTIPWVPGSFVRPVYIGDETDLLPDGEQSRALFKQVLLGLQKRKVRGLW